MTEWLTYAGRAHDVLRARPPPLAYHMLPSIDGWTKVLRPLRLLTCTV